MTARKITLSILSTIALLITATTAQASDSAGGEGNHYTFSFGIDPLLLLVHGIGGTFDVPLTDTFSVGVDGFYIFNHSDSFSDSGVSYDYQWSEWSAMLHSQYMLTNNLFSDGIYLATGVGVISAHIRNFSDFNYSGDLTAPTARATLGYQWVMSHTKFMLGAGYQYYQNSNVSVKDSNGNQVDSVNTGSNGGLALDAAIGFNF